MQLPSYITHIIQEGLKSFPENTDTFNFIIKKQAIKRKYNLCKSSDYLSLNFMMKLSH